MSTFIHLNKHLDRAKSTLRKKNTMNYCLPLQMNTFGPIFLIFMHGLKSAIFAIFQKGWYGTFWPMYSGWGFLPSQWDIGIFWFREASQSLSLFRQLFFLVSKGGPKVKCWKIAIIIHWFVTLKMNKIMHFWFDNFTVHTHTDFTSIWMTKRQAISTVAFQAC